MAARQASHDTANFGSGGVVGQTILSNKIPNFLLLPYNSSYYLDLYHLPNLFQTRGTKTLPDLSMYLIFLPMHDWCKLENLLTNARLVHTRYTRVLSKKMPPP